MFGLTFGKMLWDLRGQIAIALAVLAVLGYIGTLHYKISNRDEQISALSDKLVIKDAELVTEKGKVRVLEIKLSDMVDAGKVAEANAQLWKKKFEESSKTYRDTISNITKWRPKENETDCESSTRILNDYRSGKLQSIPR